MAVSDSSNPINGRLKVLAFGAGAISTYIGGSLALAGHQVVFVARPNTVEEMRGKGMRLDLTLDSRRNTKEATLLDPSSFVILSSLEDALRYGPFDLTLFALKSYDTQKLLDEIRPFVEKIPPVLCLSNGIANEKMIADALGVNKVIYGTVTTAVTRRGPGDIALERLRGVGVAKGHPLAEKANQAMDKALLNSQLFEDAASMKWSKMLTNLMANPSSAILNMTPAEIFANKALFEVEIEMLKECLAVMDAQGIEVVDLPGAPVRALAFATRLPLWLSRPLLGRVAGAGRGGKMPSFHIDLHTGRGKSEVEYLHGEVVRAGEMFNVPTPVNKALTDTLMSLTRGDLPLEEFAHQPEKLIAKVQA